MSRALGCQKEDGNRPINLPDRCCELYLSDHSAAGSTPNIEIVGTPQDTHTPQTESLPTTTYSKLAKVASESPSVSREEGVIDIPVQERMRIPLRLDWEDKGGKDYPLGAYARKVIADTFDKLATWAR